MAKQDPEGRVRTDLGGGTRDIDLEDEWEEDLPPDNPT